MATACPLSILTFNLGLLGTWPFEPASHLRHRIRAIPQHLRDTGADIIALQEAFAPHHRRHLRRAMAPTHPHLCTPGRRRSLLGTGLMLFSRHPILSHRFHRHPSASALLFERGALAASIATPSGAALPLVVVHLEPDSGPTRPRRHAEARSMLAAAHATSLLVGDFNCSPLVAPAIYERITAAGYQDVHLMLGGREDPTWDAANPLNRAGRHRDCPSQRIDHVFLPPGTSPGTSTSTPTGMPPGTSIRPIASTIVLTTATAPLPGGGTTPISDHHALLVHLSVPAPSARPSK